MITGRGPLKSLMLRLCDEVIFDEIVTATSSLASLADRACHAGGRRARRINLVVSTVSFGLPLVSHLVRGGHTLHKQEL